jgi:hypothetical protein
MDLIYFFSRYLRQNMIRNSSFCYNLFAVSAMFKVELTLTPQSDATRLEIQDNEKVASQIKGNNSSSFASSTTFAPGAYNTSYGSHMTSGAPPLLALVDILDSTSSTTKTLEKHRSLGHRLSSSTHCARVSLNVLFLLRISSAS